MGWRSSSGSKRVLRRLIDFSAGMVMKGSPLVQAPCSERISRSAIRNESVDSAPWFSLARSGCRPSRQPPVTESYRGSCKSLSPRNQLKADQASVAPAAVASYAVGLQARRNRAGGLQRLLIEARLLTILVVEALRTDRHKVAIDFAVLRF